MDNKQYLLASTYGLLAFVTEFTRVSMASRDIDGLLAKIN